MEYGTKTETNVTNIYTIYTSSLSKHNFLRWAPKKKNRNSMVKLEAKSQPWSKHNGIFCLGGSPSSFATLLAPELLAAGAILGGFKMCGGWCDHPLI